METRALRPTILLIAFALFPPPLASAQAPVWKGKITRDGDVTVVYNPKEPMYKGEVLFLKEELVLGGEKAQGEAVFSRAWRIAVDGEGRVYVGDAPKACIKVFDKSGAFIRTIGRRGQGPGEMTWIDSISIGRDGQELFIGDMGRLVVFDLQGIYKKSYVSRGLNEPVGLDARGNVLVYVSEIRERRSVLRIFAPEMNRIVCDIAVIPDAAQPNLYMARAYWILDPLGRVVFGYPKTYEIGFYDDNYRLTRKIRRDFEPARVNDEDRKEYLRRSNPPGVSGPPKYPCPSIHCPYRSFLIDDHGRLIIQTWDRTPDGKQDIHDVFDAEGRLLGRFALNGHPDAINPTPTILKGGKLYTVETDAEGFEVVKRYSVTWLH